MDSGLRPLHLQVQNCNDKQNIMTYCDIYYE